MSTTKPTAIITSPPYTDLTTNLTKSPTTTTTTTSNSTTSPTSTTKARSKSTSSNSSTDIYAQRAMSNTSTWQPKLDRRQSWSNEEYKHLMQSRSGSTGGTYSARGGEGQEGFSEDGHGTGY